MDLEPTQNKLSEVVEITEDETKLPMKNHSRSFPTKSPSITLKSFQENQKGGVSQHDILQHKNDN